MPHHDKRTGDLILRIVYDGAPEAGKTTNVRQLAELVALSRRGKVEAPGTTGRATEFFDWLDFTGGYVDGRRLRCQLVSVPGQPALLRRRRYLLETSDAVVFVADSDRALVELNRATFAQLTHALARVGERTAAPIGVVLQANKQDQPEALAPDALSKHLSLGANVPVVAARAHEAVGVRESFLLAVRLAAERARIMALRGGIADATPDDESFEALHQRLVESEEDSPLELALGAVHPPHEWLPVPVGRPIASVASERPPDAPRPQGVEPAASRAPVSALEPVPPLAEDVSVAARSSVDHDASLPDAAAPVPPPPAPLAVPEASTIPAGCAWPPVTGRAVFASVHASILAPALEPRRWAPPDALELASPRGLVVHTRVTWRYATLELGRRALLSQVRGLLSLRGALPEDRAVALGPDGDGWRLWMVTPDVPTLADELAAREVGGLSHDAFAERLIDAYRSVRATLGADEAAPLTLESVARDRGAWVVLALPDAPPAPRRAPISGPFAKVLRQRLAQTETWPALMRVLSEI